MADPSKRFVGYDAETWGAVADLLRSGMGPTAISRMPGMPSAVRIGQKRRESPDLFAGVVVLPAPGRHSDETWALVSELLHDGVTAKDISRMPGMPHWTTIGDRCRRDPDLRQFVNRNRTVAQGRLAAAIEALREGRSLTDITKRDGIISWSTIEKYRQRSPALARLINSLVAANHEAMKKARRDQARRRHAVDPAGAMAAVEKAVPRTMATDVRREIVAMMLADLVEGALRLEDVPKRVAEYRTRFYRQFSKFGPQSLDAPAYRDGGRATVGDTIDASTFHF